MHVKITSLYHSSNSKFPVKFNYNADLLGMQGNINILG